VSIQAQILNLLKDKVTELNLTLIFVAHDLAVVKYLCSSMAVMERGKIVEQGDSNSIFGNPIHDYTKSLLKAIPTPNPIAERERLSLAKVQ
jgi:ABC-type oligopeptide transport system ATPase subunit